MEASTGPLSLPNPPFKPDLEKIKRHLLKYGVTPTPKILHNLRKKELQKYNRRLAKRNSKLPPPLTDAQQKALDEEADFQLIKYEYKEFTKSLGHGERQKLVGVPWEGLERLRLREILGQNSEYDGEHLGSEHLRELGDIIECERDKFSWLLDDDIEIGEGWFENDRGRLDKPKRRESDAIKLLIDRLRASDLTVKNWKFVRMMRYSGLQFTEGQMLKVVEGLGRGGQWRDALSVVEWVYTSKEHRHFKSRFVYTKLLTVLGRARKPSEALRIFKLMRGDAHLYPDMAAYHSLAVTLGQAGYLKELLNVIESMKEKPKRFRNTKHKNWNPELQPDIVVFNAVLNACVPKCQWKGVSWVFQQMRKYGLRPNGASYGLAMEVMLKSGKYDLVHELFVKMKRNGEALKALTYKVLVKTFWEEGKPDAAVEAVRDMEMRGVIGTASVYYELARCLCFYGRSREAILEIEKMRRLHPTRPLAMAFTGMIMSSMDSGHVHDCVLLFEHSKTLSTLDIGLINAMLKVYGRNDMFLRAKELFEETRKNKIIVSETGEHEHSSFPRADVYTFRSMLEASASAHQWDYFEYVYKEMTLSGYPVDKRNSTLLVEASRAGKWHLLEHAFDCTLEAGEVPSPSFFTEMMCQAVIRHDYDRAANIVNTMGLAPFQVSFQDWINLFESNRDRINQDSLCKLHEKIISNDSAKEATVLNLSRALEFLCGYCEENSIGSTASITPPKEEIPGDSRDEESGAINDTNEIDFNLKWSCSTYEGSSPNDTNNCRAEEHADPGEENAKGFLSRIAEHFNREVESTISPSYLDDTEIEEDSDADELNLEDIISSSEVEDEEEEEEPESCTPSAYEILQSWKQN